MYCLKCGKETREDRVFCDHCIEVMEQYPIKPGTPVQLPRREAAAAPKKISRRKNRSQEEQLQQLRVTVRALIGCLVIMAGLLGFFVWQHFCPKEEAQPEKEIGQNYTVDSTAG